MAVLRKEKKSDFTVIDNGIFRDKTLSMKAKGLLCQMLSLPDNWDYSIAGLTTLVNDGESAVRSALKELKEAGYFRREQVRANGKIAKIEYVISEYKNRENLVVENPQQENLKQEKRAQLNTKESNTKESITKKYTVDDVIAQLPDELKQTARDFVEHRKNLKAPMTGHALELAIKKANKLAHGDIYKTVEILETSIMNGWKGVFELTDSKPKTKAQTGGRRDLFTRLYEEHKDDI